MGTAFKRRDCVFGHGSPSLTPFYIHIIILKHHNNLFQLTKITQKAKVLPHGNLVCKIPLTWRMLTRMTRSHCAGAAGGGQSCDPSLGAALCLHFLQTETHHSPPSPTFSPPSPNTTPQKRILAHITAPFHLSIIPCSLPKIPRSSKT